MGGRRSWHDLVRFLILTQYYPPEVGAAQARLAAFAGELVRAGHEAEIVTALPNYPTGALLPNDRGRLGRRETIDGIRVTRLWLYPASGAGFGRLVSYLSFTTTGLVGAIRARRPDVVFVESPPLFLGIAGWLAAKRFGAAFILNVSDLWPDSVRDMGVMASGPWLGLAERLERWLYRRADAVTAVTEGIARRLTTVKGVPRDRVLFLPNGADTDRFRPAPPPAGLETRRPSILYAGNHGLAQGLEVVIGAAELAPELDFVLIGDGSDKARLQALADERGVGNILFEPPVDPSQIAGRYARAAAGLASLRRSELMEDARPAKLLAIMACGRPVLYAGSGEGAELVRTARAGIVVPPEDPHALAAAARAIVADTESANAMGASGRRYVEEHLSWPLLAARWLSQLDELRATASGPMTDANRIRDYFESAGWKSSPGREYIADERMALLRAAVSSLAIPLSELNLCDVGCGGGADLGRWRDAGVPETRIAGTELVPGRAALARGLLPAAEIREVDGFDLPFNSGSFDVCTASLVFSTIRSTPHRRHLLEEMARVTRPGGMVIVYDFVIRKPWNRHVSALSTRELTRLWKPPDQVRPAAPLLPALNVALRLPRGTAKRVAQSLPRTHRLWVWKTALR